MLVFSVVIDCSISLYSMIDIVLFSLFIFEWILYRVIVICARVGSGSLTPLTPISMQDIKAHMLGSNGLVDSSLQYQGIELLTINKFPIYAVLHRAYITLDTNMSLGKKNCPISFLSITYVQRALFLYIFCCLQVMQFTFLFVFVFVLVEFVTFFLIA